MTQRQQIIRLQLTMLQCAHMIEREASDYDCKIGLEAVQRLRNAVAEYGTAKQDKVRLEKAVNVSRNSRPSRGTLNYVRSWTR